MLEKCQSPFSPGQLVPVELFVGREQQSAFQALLDYLSAGTWTGAMGVISAIAKFLNWPM